MRSCRTKPHKAAGLSATYMTHQVWVAASFTVCLLGLGGRSLGQPSGPEVFSAAQAKELVENNRTTPTLQIDQVKTLTNEIADELAWFAGERLMLNGLTELTDTAALALAKYNGALVLDGVTSLTPAAAKALAQRKGSLSLNGLSAVPDSVAEQLGKARGRVSLAGLTRLTNGDLARVLCQEGLFQLGERVQTNSGSPTRERVGVETLQQISPAVARVIVQSFQGHSRGREMRLRSLASLTPAIASELAQFRGELELGVESLAEEAAICFANHDAKLIFSSLADLKPGAARALASHKGDLEFGALTSLSPENAAELAKCPKDLSFPKLTSLSAPSAEALASHRGDLWITVPELSVDAARHLASHRGTSFIGGLKTLSPESAAHLVGLRFLDLSSLADVTPGLAEVLAERQGVLDLSGLKQMPDEVARALSVHEGSLNLSGLTEIGDRALAFLCRHKGRLELDGLRSLSVDQARALAGLEYDLSLDRLTCLGGAAREIARHRHGVSLMGIKSISEEEARAVQDKDRGVMYLPFLEKDWYRIGNGRNEHFSKSLMP
jgi:hypothetical protein